MDRKRYPLISLSKSVRVAVILMGLGAVLWVLSAVNIIGGSWSPVLSILFTFFGTVFSLFQWYVQIREDRTRPGKLSLQKGTQQRRGSFVEDESMALSTPLSGGWREIVIEQKQTDQAIFIRITPCLPTVETTVWGGHDDVKLYIKRVGRIRTPVSLNMTPGSVTLLVKNDEPVKRNQELCQGI